MLSWRVMERAKGAKGTRLSAERSIKLNYLNIRQPQSLVWWKKGAKVEMAGNLSWELV